MAVFRNGLSIAPVAVVSVRLCVTRQARRCVGSPRLWRCLTTQPSLQEESTENSAKNWTVDPLTGKSRVGSNWNYNMELLGFAERLGYQLKELPSLRGALVDRGLLGSVPRREGVEASSLSVFGRATMMYYVMEYLHFTYPNLEGSMLTDLCEFLTGDATLSELASYTGITDLIRTRKQLSNPDNATVITNAFCAVIGAICRDKGGTSARTFVHNFVVTQLAGKDLHELIKLQHPRFMLHAILKSQGLAKPESRLLRETGRATHFPSFVVGVYSGESLLGEGCGTSIKRAEREAMVAALQTRFQSELSHCPLPSDHDDYCREEELMAKHSQTHSDV